MPYQQVTLAQLQAYFYERVGGNTAFWRTTEVTAILQEAVRVFNVLTGYWRGSVSVGPTVASQHWYNVPSGLSYITRVECNQTPLNVSSLWDLDYGQPTWESDVATSGNQPNAWAPCGVNLFALWPASFAGGESLVAFGVTTAPVLTSVGFIDLGQSDIETILDYAEHIAQFKEGGQEFEASQLWLSEFLKESSARNAILQNSAKWRNWLGLSDRKWRPIHKPEARVGAR
jgi:hypothetical protein